MQAIELETKIDESHQIHLQLPENIKAGKAKVIVMYEQETPPPNKPFKYGLFKDQLEISDDFDDPLPDSFWLEGKI